MFEISGVGGGPRVVVIGAGMAGLLCAIKLREAGYDNIAIYEKADRIGGTWRENTYPGLTCDVPSHAYTYSFAPNPDWSRHLPPGQEIYEYFAKIVETYDLVPLLHFNREVIDCRFENGRWQLTTKSGLKDSADFVIPRPASCIIRPIPTSGAWISSKARCSTAHAGTMALRSTGSGSALWATARPVCRSCRPWRSVQAS
jgi:hypothetical protein